MAVVTRPDGRIYCAYWDPATRRHCWESFGRGAGAQVAAETRDLEIKLEKKNNHGKMRKSGCAITYNELVQKYVNARAGELSTRSVDDMLRAVAKYASPVIGKKYLDQIDLNDWNLILARIQNRNVKTRTINVYFHYFKKILDWAAYENDFGLAINPWHRRHSLRQPPAEKFRVDLFTLSEFAAIHAAAGKYAPHLQWAMELLYYTGMRPVQSELYGLTWNDIDYTRNAIHIRGTKNAASDRWQYPDPAFMSRLRRRQRRDRLEYPACPYVLHYRGQRLATAITDAWATAKKGAGITRRIRLYDIRHYYITYALAGGADIMDLAHRVGHTDAEMIVKVYAHLAEGLKGQAAHRLPNLYETLESAKKNADVDKNVDKRRPNKNRRPRKTA